MIKNNTSAKTGFMVKVKDAGYIILLREIVIQLNSKIVYSGNTTPSASLLDFKLFPKELQNNSSLSKLNTKSKVNLNYVTQKINQNQQEIHNALYNVLSRTKYYTDKDGVEWLEFKNKEDLKTFRVFKSFKEINADLYDKKNFCIKYVIKHYEDSIGFEKVPYNKDFDEELGPRSIILITPNDSVIYSNRIFVNFDDFCEYKNNVITCKPIDDIYTNVSKKISQNRIYEYAKSKNDDLFLKIVSDVFEHVFKWTKRIQKD